MKFFTKAFVKKEIVRDNIVLLLLYVIATPLSRLFVWLKISPNAITFVSILFAGLAFTALVMDEGYLYYCIFWAISLHLDFCDGTVARMTGNTNKTAFRFDHMTDIFKLCLLFLGAGIRYNSNIIWILSAAASFSFLYATILNHDISWYRKITPSAKAQEVLHPSAEAAKKTNLKNRVKKSKVIRNLFSLVATINGHTLVLFLILPFGAIYVELFFIYFIILTVIRILTVINRLIHLPKIKSTN